MKNIIVSMFIILLFSSHVESQNLSLLDSTVSYTYLHPPSRTDSLRLRKMVYSYDSNNNDTLLKKSYEWDKTLNKWDNLSKTVFNYDSNNNDTLEIFYKWDETLNNWKGSKKHVFNYDSNNNDTLEIFYKWDETLNNWKLDFKKVIYYDSNNNKTSIYRYHRYHWYGELPSGVHEWEIRQKIIYKYDLNNNNISTNYYQWDIVLSNWRATYKEVRSYNLNNNLLSIESYVFNEKTNQWEKNSKRVYEYDLSNNRISSKYYEWDEILKDWIFHGTTYYYRSDLPLLNKTEELTHLNIFPNPISSKDILSIIVGDNNCFQYSIFTLNGKIIMSGFSNSKKQDIDVSILDKGIYILNITSGNKVSSQKIVK